MVKGIGPVYAKKLVAKFGERILDTIENQSARPVARKAAEQTGQSNR